MKFLIFLLCALIISNQEENQSDKNEITCQGLIEDSDNEKYCTSRSISEEEKKYKTFYKMKEA